MERNFTAEELRWLECIAARVIPLVKAGATVEQATETAVEQHRALVEEMAVGTSNRARAASRAICAKVWHDLRAKDNATKTMQFVGA